MNDAQAIDTTASAGAAASTQVLPSVAASAQAQAQAQAQARSADVQAYVTAVRSWLTEATAASVA